MKKNWITKLALAVAVAALIFSVVTLVRAIVIGNGVLFACILVVGTAVVVAVCAIMLYVIGKYDDASEDDEDDEDEDDDEDDEDDADGEKTSGAPAAAKREKRSPAPERDADEVEKEVDSLLAELEEKGGYDLHNFEK